MEKEQSSAAFTEEEYKLISELIKNGKLKEYRYLVEMFDKEKKRTCFYDGYDAK